MLINTCFFSLCPHSIAPSISDLMTSGSSDDLMIMIHGWTVKCKVLMLWTIKWKFLTLSLWLRKVPILFYKNTMAYYYTKDFKNEIFRIETKYRKAVHHQFFIRVMIFNKRIILIVQFSKNPSKVVNIETEQYSWDKFSLKQNIFNLC